jgi:hypothetical protein
MCFDKLNVAASATQQRSGHPLIIADFMALCMRLPLRLNNLIMLTETINCRHFEGERTMPFALKKNPKTSMTSRSMS